MNKQIAETGEGNAPCVSWEETAKSLNRHGHATRSQLIMVKAQRDELLAALKHCEQAIGDLEGTEVEYP